MRHLRRYACCVQTRKNTCFLVRHAFMSLVRLHALRATRSIRWESFHLFILFYSSELLSLALVFIFFCNSFFLFCFLAPFSRPQHHRPVLSSTHICDQRLISFFSFCFSFCAIQLDSSADSFSLAFLINTFRIQLFCRRHRRRRRHCFCHANSATRHATAAAAAERMLNEYIVCVFITVSMVGVFFSTFSSSLFFSLSLILLFYT